MLEEDDYQNQVDEAFSPKIDHDVYQFDSDDGRSSFHPSNYEKDTTRRRKTLPSEKTFIPTTNDWE